MSRDYDRNSYILVVDDDNTLLKFFKIHLNKFFSRVIVVKNAKEAIETIRGKDIDMIITDIRMPRMDGLQLLGRIRNFDASIPVALVSGALLTDEQHEVVMHHTDGFLKKPFTVEELHELIDTGLQRREILKELSEIIGRDNNKLLLGLLQGGEPPTSLAEDQRSKAQELCASLKAS